MATVTAAEALSSTGACGAAERVRGGADGRALAASGARVCTDVPCRMRRRNDASSPWPSPPPPPPPPPRMATVTAEAALSSTGACGAAERVRGGADGRALAASGAWVCTDASCRMRRRSDAWSPWPTPPPPPPPPPRMATVTAAEATFLARARRAPPQLDAGSYGDAPHAVLTARARTLRALLHTWSTSHRLSRDGCVSATNSTKVSMLARRPGLLACPIHYPRPPSLLCPAPAGGRWPCRPDGRHPRGAPQDRRHEGQGRCSVWPGRLPACRPERDGEAPR